MKRLASVVAVRACSRGRALAPVTARADLNFAIQAASSKQTAVAVAPAIQYSGPDSLNLNVSKASAANYSSIQWLVQVNH
jgi:hypothetical protein